MLRWVLGDQKFDVAMRTTATKFAGQSLPWMTSAPSRKNNTARS